MKNFWNKLNRACVFSAESPYKRDNLAISMLYSLKAKWNLRRNCFILLKSKNLIFFKWVSIKVDDWNGNESKKIVFSRLMVFLNLLQLLAFYWLTFLGNVFLYVQRKLPVINFKCFLVILMLKTLPVCQRYTQINYANVCMFTENDEPIRKCLCFCFWKTRLIIQPLDKSTIWHCPKKGANKINLVNFGLLKGLLFITTLTRYFVGQFFKITMQNLTW